MREDHVWANRFQIEGFFRRNADTSKPFGYANFNSIPGVYFNWSRNNGRFFEFHFDYWLLLTIGGAIPLTRLARAARGAARRRRAQRAARDHRCTQCGYDLRATPDRCPECGTVTGTVAAIPDW